MELLTILGPQISTNLTIWRKHHSNGALSQDKPDWKGIFLQPLVPSSFTFLWFSCHYPAICSHCPLFLSGLPAFPQHTSTWIVDFSAFMKRARFRHNSKVKHATPNRSALCLWKVPLHQVHAPHSARITSQDMRNSLLDFQAGIQ